MWQNKNKRVDTYGARHDSTAVHDCCMLQIKRVTRFVFDRSFSRFPTIASTKPVCHCCGQGEGLGSKSFKVATTWSNIQCDIHGAIYYYMEQCTSKKQ